LSGVFINYRGEDSDTAAVLIDRELAARFGSDQVFLDSRSIPVGADFVEDLLGRLRTCSVLLAVIGPRWLTLTDAAGQRRIDDPRDWIRRELVEALSHGLRVIPVLTDGVAMPTEEDLPLDIAGLSRRQYVPLRRRYTSVDLAFLIERITEVDPGLDKATAAAQRAVAGALRFPGAWPAVFSGPPRNPNFTGRDSELDRIRAGLVAGTALTVQTLRGMAGVGKTQTVSEYAHRYACEYDLVWWINAGQPTLIPGQLAALAKPLGLPEGLFPDDAVRGVCAELARRSSDWLLIFDNAEHPTDVRPMLPYSGGHVLITTRRSGFGSLGPVLDLDVLPRDDAVALLQRRSPALTSADAGALVDLLGCLPLALDQAAGYLDQTRLPATDYLQLMRTRAPDMFTPRPGSPASGHHRHPLVADP